MVTRSTDRVSPLPKPLEFPENPTPKASAPLDNAPSNQEAQFLNSTNPNQALRHLRQTYSLERRTFL